ncbi:MAG: hypothetical protein Q7T61_04495 [Caulobacter sp.]|nr:hypothetical protein [Caulobacter sp.]
MTTSNRQAMAQQDTPGAGRRTGLFGQPSRQAMMSALGAVAMASTGLLIPGLATAADTVTTDTTTPTNPPNDRHTLVNSAATVEVIVASGDMVSGNGVALTNTGSGTTVVTNDGVITVDIGATPTAGGTAAVNLTANGGLVAYVGSGSVINNGVGGGVSVTQQGAGALTVNSGGSIVATTGEGVVARDVAASTGMFVGISGNVTALAVGQDGVDAQSQSLTGNITVVTVGDIAAGNAGVVAAILPGAATGDIDVTILGEINARFGVDAENFGTGSTTVLTGGDVNAATGNGVFALTRGGNLLVLTGAVTSTGNTAIVARQDAGAGAGAVSVGTSGPVSGTTGIAATNLGTGATSVDAGSTVTGTAAEGLVVTAGGAVTVQVADVVTGALSGASVTGSGAISVTGAGGFIGQSGNGLSIQNNGAAATVVDISGPVVATGGDGIVVLDVAAGTGVSVTTGSVSAIGFGRDAIDVTSNSVGGDLVIVANGNLTADNAGVVALLANVGAAGDIDVTVNGAIDARFGIAAQNFGTGSTTVTAVGDVNATTGNGIFAEARGTVTITAGSVTSTGEAAIFAQDLGGVGALSVSTTGDVVGTIGIDAVSGADGPINITTGGTVTGTVGEGIRAANNFGGVTLQVADAVTGATTGADITGSGAISVTGAGGFVGQNGAGLTIQNNGAATTVVDLSGAVAATGGDGIQVRDAAVGTGVSITTGAVTALSAGQSGVDAVSFSLTGDLTVVTNGDVAADNGGVVAALFAGAGTGNVSVTTNGAASGRFGIDAENQGSGSVTVTAVGPVTGGTGGGVFALTGGGDITVATGEVTATGATGITAFQFLGGGAGDISLTTNGDVSGTFGIQAINNGSGGVTVSAGGAVTGATAVGIELTGNAAVTLQVADVVTGAVEGAVITGSGPVSVTGAGGFVGQSGAGLTIQNNGAAATLVNVAGAVSATNGDGVNIRDVAGGTGVSVTTGAVTALTAGRDGIDVSSLSLTGDVTVVTNGDVTGASAAIRAALTDAASTGDVTVIANGALGGGAGVQAQTAGSGAVSVTAIGPIAVSGSGVTAQTQGGDVSIATGAIDAGFIGVFAQQNDAAGVGDISVATNGAVSGLRGIQITNAGSGDITVTSDSTVTANGGFGLSAIGNGAVTLQVADTISGTFGGMQLQGGGDISITGAGGFVGQGTGMFILSTGAGAININLAGPIVSANNAGLIIVDGLTGGDVNVTTGAVTATGGPFGRTALDLLSGSLTADVTVVTNGAVTASGTGISAGLLEGGATGDVRVTSNGAINTGTGSGISASNNGAGSIAINAVGPIVSTGGRGILVTSRQGDVSVTAGSVTATASSAIETRQLVAAASGDTSVTVNGAVSGLNGIRVDTLGSGDVTLVNTAGGSISGATNSILSAQTGGVFRLTNAGAVNGRLTVSGSTVAASLLTNTATGVINTGAGASSVSGGLSNAGIVNIGAGGSLTFLGGTTNTGRINLAGAGAFTTNGAMTNSGVLSAQNGVVGNLITVGGGYAGGGQLLVDYSTATATADRLLIGGAATGVTNVSLNRVGPRTLVAGGFLPIVTVAGAASDNAFTSNTALFSPGFILDSFGRNPANATQFGLIQSINPSTASLAALSFVGEAASQLLNEPVGPHVLAANEGDQRLNFWIRAGASSTTQTLSGSIVGGGLVLAGEGDVETEQTVLQVGADIALLRAGDWRVHVGLTGGVFDADSRSLGDDQVGVDGQFVGGYVVVGGGAFSLDAALRKEWRDYSLYLPTLLGPTGEHDLDGEAIAASVRAAWRVGGEAGWSATPFVSYDYADGDIDDLQVDTATIYSPGGKTTQIGQLGVKVAYRASLGLVSLEPFASVSAMKNWSTDERSTYLFNAPATTFVQDVEGWEDAVSYSLGVTGGTPDGRVGGFLVGTVNDGSRLEGYSLTAGFKVRF